MSDLTLNGRLTADKYDHWYKFSTRWIPPMEDMHADYLERTIQTQFRILSKSDFVLDNFFKLHPDFQGFVEEFAGDEYTSEDIESFIRLALLVQDSLPDLDSIEDSPHTVLYYLMDKISHEAAVSVYDALYDSVHDDCVMLFKDSPNIAKPVIVLLAVTYGAPLVMSVIERWSKEDSPGTASELIAIVENWETVKSYPLLWAVNLVRTDAHS